MTCGSSSPRSERESCGRQACVSCVHLQSHCDHTLRSSSSPVPPAAGASSAPVPWCGLGSQPPHACPRRFPAAVSPSNQRALCRLPSRMGGYCSLGFSFPTCSKGRATVPISTWRRLGLDFLICPVGKCPTSLSGFLWVSVSPYTRPENPGCATSEPMAGFRIPVSLFAPPTDMSLLPPWALLGRGRSWDNPV